MYYPCSENKCADQLRGYREADLRLYFRICKKPTRVKRMQRSGTEAIRTEIQPSEPKRENTKITIKHYNETMNRVHGCKHQHFKPKLTKLHVVGSRRVQLKIKLLSGGESSLSNIVNYIWYFISTVVNPMDPQNNKLLTRQPSSTISILRRPLSKHPLPSLRGP